MKHPAFAIMLSVLAAHTLFGQTTSNPPLQKFLPANNAIARRMVTEQFSQVDDLTKVDPEVLALFHSKVGAADIANRGEAFNSTDVVTANRPMRRFAFAGSAPSIWFILYEHGGIAYHHNLVGFSKNGHWQIAAAVQGLVKGEPGFESLKQAIKAGQFFGQSGHPEF